MRNRERDSERGLSTYQTSVCKWLRGKLVSCSFCHITSGYRSVYILLYNII